MSCEGVTPADALRHPTWTMGAKITIDSATLMNKGLEVIEAHHLFGLALRPDRGGGAPAVDGPRAWCAWTTAACWPTAGPPDMRVPIGYALRHPAAPPPGAPMDLVGRRLDFEAPDEDAFPCLPLAREAGRAGGTAPAVLNAANEVAVAAFLAERIGFMDIPRVVEAALEAVPARPARHARSRARRRRPRTGGRRGRHRPVPGGARVNILWFVGILMGLVVVHEAGHMVVAKCAACAWSGSSIFFGQADLVVHPRRDGVRHRLAAPRRLREDQRDDAWGRSSRRR